MTATDTALAKVYTGTYLLGSSRTRTSRHRPTRRWWSRRRTPVQQGLVAIQIAQHVRQGRVAGHPRDACSSALPDRARAEGCGAETATRWRRSCPARNGLGTDRRWIWRWAPERWWAKPALHAQPQFHGEWLHRRSRDDLEGWRSSNSVLRQQLSRKVKDSTMHLRPRMGVSYLRPHRRAEPGSYVSSDSASRSASSRSSPT